ncbi:MAG TPA: hypothetical protein VMS73_01010 [Anaerolineaceae bacterium]|nr:hypothetical protein [Anaerolineaceae bacterium]
MNLTSTFPRLHPIFPNWLLATVLTILLALTLLATLQITFFTPGQPAQSNISSGQLAPHFEPMPTPNAAMVTDTPVPPATLNRSAQQPNFVPVPVPTPPANH